VELVEKERNYFKVLVEEKEKDIGKLNLTIKANENHESNSRKGYEDKLKKVEEDKLALLSSKNM